MWIGIVGSRNLGECSCKPTWAPHVEDCPKLESWLLMLKTVTRLAGQKDFEGIVSGGARGADTMAKDAAMLLGVKVVEYQPLGGREPFWERAKKRNQKIVDKVSKTHGWVVALFAPGPRSPGTSDTIERAKAAGLKTFIHEYNREGRGQWVTE
jgi:hypothetical protein